MNIEHEHVHAHAPDEGAHARHGHGHVPGPGHETRDANVNALLSFGVGLIIALVVVHFLVYGFYYLFLSERPKKVPVQPTTNLYQQLRDLHSHEEATLERYGWVDRKAGVVRIPIERAIELVAEKGIPFGKGPKSELEMISHAGTPVAVPSADKGTTSPGSTGPKP
jgi:hypothetical protein